MFKYELEEVGEDSLSFTIEVTDDDDDPVNISNWTILFTVKRRRTDDSGDALISESVGPGQHTDPEEGLTGISISPDDTDLPPGKYYCDFTFDMGADQRKTLLGRYIVDRRVTDV